MNTHASAGSRLHIRVDRNTVHKRCEDSDIARAQGERDRGREGERERERERARRTGSNRGCRARHDRTGLYVLIDSCVCVFEYMYIMGSREDREGSREGERDQGREREAGGHRGES